MAVALPLVQAIINGLTFAGQGTIAPHRTYNVDPAVRYLVGLETNSGPLERTDP
jgi:hypothetical protein